MQIMNTLENTSLIKIKFMFESIYSSTHQLIEDVSLVDMDGDERLVLGPLILAQLPGRHVDQLIEEV